MSTQRTRASYGSTFIFLLLLHITYIIPIYAKPSPKQIKQFLVPQNAARAALGMQPLVWNSVLANYAQQYAKQRRGDCSLKHSNGPYGENIFWGSGTRWTPAQAAASWVSESRWYNYGSNTCALGRQCGHYTQIVWKETTKIGCAKVNCNKGKGVFIICNYDPPGNFNGEKPY